MNAASVIVLAPTACIIRALAFFTVTSDRQTLSAISLADKSIIDSEITCFSKSEKLSEAIFVHLFSTGLCRHLSPVSPL